MNANLMLCKRFCDITFACADYATKTVKSGKKITIFCEDRFTLNIESQICNIIGGSFDIKVTTFSRFLKRKINALPLSKEGSVMAIAAIILSLDDKLLYLNPKKTKNCAQAVYEIIAQLKSSKISPQMLINYDGKSAVLKNKLADLYLIYTKYEEFLASGYEDENSYLALVTSFLASDEFVSGQEVIFAGYSSFTKQGAAVIESALECASTVTGIFCGGESEIYTNESSQYFEKACAELGVFINKTMFEKNIGKEQQIICENLFEPQVFRQNNLNFTDNIFIYEARSVNEEFSQILSKIAFEIKHNGRSYKDIAVICADTEKDNLIRCLEREKVPYFTDIKKPLIEHPLSKFLLSYLKMHESGFLMAECIKFIKNPYFEIDTKLTDIFENYLISRGNYSTLLFKQVDEERQDGALLEALRLRVIGFKKLQKTERVENFCMALESLLTDINSAQTTEKINKNLDLRTDLQFFGSGIEDKIKALLEEIKQILSGSQMSLKDFLQLFESGLKSKSVSLIPAYSDAVYVGGYDFSGILPKVLFMSNLSISVPATSFDTGFISDKDIELLENFRLKIQPKISIINMRARQSAGIIAASFEDTLHLSYSLYNADGKTQRKSDIVSYIQKIFTHGNNAPLTALTSDFFTQSSQSENLYYHIFRFTDLSVGAINFMSDISSYQAGNILSIDTASAFYFSVDESTKSQLDWFLKNADTDIAARIQSGRELFLSGGFLSVSSLQNFYECPYRNFLASGLKLKERDDGEINPVDSGNILHAAAEELFITQLEFDEKLQEMCKTLINQSAAKGKLSYIKENAKNKILLERLANELARIYKASQLHRQNTLFKPSLTETSFGYENSALAPLKIGQYFLHGVIDRVDEFENYIRVIDYKSGYIDDKDMTTNYFMGRKIQLWLYLNAAATNKLAAGAYYFDLNDKFVEENGDISNYVMVGMTRKTSEILAITDKNLAENKSAVSVAISPKSSDFKGQLIDSDKFDDYLNYSKAIAQMGADYLSQGIIAQSPCENACSYCRYLGVCDIDLSENSARKQIKITAEEIATATQKYQVNVGNSKLKESFLQKSKADERLKKISSGEIIDKVKHD